MSVVKQVKDNEVIQQKQYEKEQDDIKKIKQFIASAGTYANLVKQAKSKQARANRRRKPALKLSFSTPRDAGLPLSKFHPYLRATTSPHIHRPVTAPEGLLSRHSRPSK